MWYTANSKVFFEEAVVIKFLLIGDRHAGPSAPLARIDDFESSFRDKDFEILKIARENNVDAIIEAGDFFEEGRSRLSNEYIHTILSRWFGVVSLSDVLTKKSEMSDREFIDYINSIKRIRMIGVAGNHELQGGAKETLANTTLGLVNSLGYIDLPTKDSPLIMKDRVTGKTIAVTATSYHSLMDNPEFIDDYIIDKKLGDFHIHIVHGMLVDKPLAPNRVFTTIDQIKDKTKADLTLCGHIHTGFKTVHYNGKYFVNPGAVVRLTASKDEMARTVHVVLCEITDKIALTEIPLKCVKPSSEVLSRDHILRKRKNKSISEFYDEEVENFKLSTAKRIDDILNDILDNEGIPEELKQVYIDKVNAKKGSIMTSIPPQKDAWVKSLRLKNFQSHAEQFLTFSPGMNLLVGESDNGKSAILRAIYWVYTGKPSGTSMVRRGEDTCEVEIELANGTKVEHKLVVNASNSAKSQSNTYKITYPNGAIEEGNTRLLPKVQEVLGYCPFQIDDGKAIDINFMRQGEGWFLIGDEVSSPQRAKIIGSIMDTNCVDACMRDCEKEIQTNERQTTMLKSEVDTLAEQEATYSDLEDKKKLVQSLRNAYAELQTISKKIEKIKEVNEKINMAKTKIKDCTEIIDAITKFDFVAGISELKDVVNKTISVSNASQKLEASKKSLEGDISLINRLSNAPAIPQSVSELSGIITRYSKIYELGTKRDVSIKVVQNCVETEKSLTNIAIVNSRMEELKKIFDKISIISDIDAVLRLKRQYSRNAGIIISRCSRVEDMQAAINSSREILDKIDKIVSAKTAISQIQKNITVTGYTIRSHERTLKDIEDKKEKILAEFDVCPFCGQEILNGGHEHG